MLPVYLPHIHNFIVFTFLYYVGLENRPKDIGRFYFWMTVRGKDLDFLVANLNDDESACNIDEITGSTTNTQETSYAKRKRREEEAAASQRMVVKKEQIDLFKELMSPGSDNSDVSSSPGVNDSIVEKNLAYANNKRVSSMHTEAMTTTEKVNNLLKVMDNTNVWGMYSREEQLKMQNDLKMLLSK